MSEKSSFWCSSFSRGWWWLLTLLGLPLLFFLMNHFQQKQIENDVALRVTEALQVESSGWAEVDVNQRGRDVLLRGEPPSEAELAKTIAVAEGVYGVNRVDYAGDMSATSAGDATQEGDTTDASNATDTTAKSTAQDSAAAGDGQVAGADQDADKDATQADAAGDKAEPATADAAGKQLLPAELKMTKEGDQLILDGKMASQAQIDALQQAAVLQVGVANVVNNLQMDEQHAEAGWLKGVGDLMGALPAGSQAVVKGDTLELSGDIESGDARTALSSRAGSALQGSGLQLLDALNVVVPEPGEAEEKQAAAENEVKQAVCQQRLNTAMQGKNILFTFNQASINTKSYSLLDSLSQIISECGDEMKGVSILIGGHTDSVGKDAYNLDLSQRRADAVSDYLQGKGIDAALLEAKGFGESKPVASNSTARGQAQNRRITFEIKQK